MSRTPRRRARLLRALLLSALPLVASCASPAPEPPPEPETPKAALIPGTGDYSRPISTDSSLAQQFFDQGLRLVYGYYFPEAAASFLEALRHDPHPMIEWGLALSIGPNPNSRYFGATDDPRGEGRKALERARRTAARATDVERDFIEALAVRFDEESHPETASRDAAYLESARSLAERHPEDDDAGTLYADAFMTSSAWRYWDREGKPAAGTLDAARALERVMDRNVRHPGANHLYIHLLEASREPERALPQADRLADLMPNAGHIVHMPSHIYVRVGMYDKAIATNERSVAADETFLTAWGDIPLPTITTYRLSARIHAGHSMGFIRYTATIQGNYGRVSGWPALPQRCCSPACRFRLRGCSGRWPTCGSYTRSSVAGTRCWRSRGLRKRAIRTCTGSGTTPGAAPAPPEESRSWRARSSRRCAPQPRIPKSPTCSSLRTPHRSS